nr:MAG TPA: hypothetical protein [Caudoviricetes sp.]
MKFDTVLLIFTLIYALGTDWSIPSCILVICCSIYVLCCTLPRIRRSYHELKKDKK